MRRADSLEKNPEAGKNWGQEEKGMTEDEMVGWHHWFNDMGLERLQQLVMDTGAWNAMVHGVTKNQTWLSEWTELSVISFPFFFKTTVFWNIRGCIFLLFLAMLHGTWDLSSPSRNGTWTPALERWSLNHWTAGWCMCAQLNIWTAVINILGLDNDGPESFTRCFVQPNYCCFTRCYASSTKSVKV